MKIHRCRDCQGDVERFKQYCDKCRVRRRQESIKRSSIKWNQSEAGRAFMKKWHAEHYEERKQSETYRKKHPSLYGRRSKKSFYGQVVLIDAQVLNSEI